MPRNGVEGREKWLYDDLEAQGASEDKEQNAKDCKRSGASQTSRLRKQASNPSMLHYLFALFVPKRLIFFLAVRQEDAQNSIDK
jgi:hypothetical protein